MSPAISVIVLSENIDAYKKYCSKSNRADLEDEYRHLSLSLDIIKFEQYLKENTESKKYLIDHFITNFC